MTNKETVVRNIGLTFDFVNYLKDNPEKINELPEKFNLEFIEKDFSNIEKSIVSDEEDQIVTKEVRVRNSFDLAD
jgi:hypothetical protein